MSGKDQDESGNDQGGSGNDQGGQRNDVTPDSAGGADHGISQVGNGEGLYEPDLTSTPGPPVVPAVSSSEEAKSKRKRKPFRVEELRSLFRDVVYAVGACLFIIFFIIQPFRVEGSSMEPALSDGDRIIVNKFIYRFRDIQRGDVVVLKYPADPEKTFIKRVIGLPGDWVELREGMVYINNTLLDEPYIPEEFRTHGYYRARRPVDKGYYFVMGDHRSRSNDSRSFGFVPRDYIIGKAFVRFWPPRSMESIE